MDFKPSIYFFNLKDKQSTIEIKNYNAFFKRGILICHKILYYLVVGSYCASNPIKDIPFGEKERKIYKALNGLLTNIKNKIEKTPCLVITPHIFTKFINEIWRFKKHFKGIIETFIKDFTYVDEEQITKKEILDIENFRIHFYGLSETSILILKKKGRCPCILSWGDKPYPEDEDEKKVLYIGFLDLMSFMYDMEFRSQLT